MRGFLILVLFSVAMIGCKSKVVTPAQPLKPYEPPPDWVADIVCDSRWSGYFSDHVEEGDGSKIVDLPDSGYVCAEVKLKEQGLLWVRIKDMRNHKDGQNVMTRNRFETVTACNR